MSHRTLTRVLAALLAVAPLTAMAQPAAPAPMTDIESARMHFRQGSKFYDLGRFTDAAHEYEAAFEAKEDPALLFNIGQAYRFGGENAKALGAYKAYLRRSPKSPRRAEVEARIAELQKLVAAEQQAKQAPPGGIANSDEKAGEEKAEKLDEHKPAKVAEPAPRVEPIPETPSNRTRRFAGIGLIAGGGALVIAGATLTGLAYSLQSAQTHPAPNVAFDPGAPSRVRVEQISGGVLLGVGAGAAVGGTVLYLLARRNQHRERVVVAPLVGARSAGLTLSGVMQ
jgi:tetratricopeptide (TPR) repeat protein